MKVKPKHRRRPKAKSGYAQAAARGQAIAVEVKDKAAREKTAPPPATPDVDIATLAAEVHNLRQENKALREFCNTLVPWAKAIEENQKKLFENDQVLARYIDRHGHFVLYGRAFPNGS